MIQADDGRFLKAKDHLVLREEYDDWAILYNPDTGRAVGLSPTGVTIWKHLELPSVSDLGAVARSIENEFADVPEDLTRSIQDFLNSTLVAGYIEVAAGAP